MPANANGRPEAVPRAVRPARLGYHFEDTYGKRSGLTSGQGPQQSGPGHAPHPRRLAQLHRVGSTPDRPGLEKGSVQATEPVSRATSASKHSDAVAFRYYNNRRTSGGTGVGSSAQVSQAGAVEGRGTASGVVLSGRRLRRHEQMMQYKPTSDSSLAGRQRGAGGEPRQGVLVDADDDDTPRSALDAVDRLPREEQKLCELLVSLLLHKAPIVAQDVLRALGQRLETRRLLRHYAGLRGTDVPCPPGDLSAADRASLIASLQAQQRALDAESNAHTATLERRRRSWLRRQGRPPRTVPAAAKTRQAAPEDGAADVFVPATTSNTPHRTTTPVLTEPRVSSALACPQRMRPPALSVTAFYPTPTTLPALEERELSPGAAAARRVYLETTAQRNLTTTCDVAEPHADTTRSSSLDATPQPSQDASLRSTHSEAAPPRLNVTAAPHAGVATTRSHDTTAGSDVCGDDSAVVGQDEGMDDDTVVATAPRRGMGRGATLAVQGRRTSPVPADGTTVTASRTDTRATVRRSIASETNDGDTSAAVVAVSQLSPIDGKAVEPSLDHSVHSGSDAFRLPWED